MVNTRSVKSRTFLYFRKDGRVTKALHSHRGLGLRKLGSPPSELLRRITDLIPQNVLEREDVIQIICMSLLSGSLTWEQFAENRTAVLREAKRLMLYSGLLSDMALVSLDKSIESAEGVELGDFLI
jgi:hypothetical protein